MGSYDFYGELIVVFWLGKIINVPCLMLYVLYYFHYRQSRKLYGKFSLIDLAGMYIHLLLIRTGVEGKFMQEMNEGQTLRILTETQEWKALKSTGVY